jgi:hypothetical protein
MISMMGWLSDALAALNDGRSIKVCPRGGSMRGRIEDGQEVTIEPVDPAAVKLNDVVLVKWKGSYILHLIKEVNGDQLLIGNNLGKVNGWVSRRDVVGRVVC